MGKVWSMHGREAERIQGFVGKPAGMRSLRKPRRRWEINIKMDLR
jgi:hypothetical protein